MKYLIGGFLGVAVLLLVKYVVVGLLAWDKVLHPHRRENPNSRFLYPVFGLWPKVKY